MKLLSVVGTRPNFIKLAPISRAVGLRKEIDHVIVNTGQHYDYEMSNIFFKGLSIPEPKYDLLVGKDAPTSQIGQMLCGLNTIIEDERPDIVLVYGDTNSTLAGAIAANKAGCTLAHIEAGLRNYNRRMAEEMNRVLIDHMSNYLFVPTETAMRNIKKELLPGTAFRTGDVAVEVVASALQTLDSKRYRDDEYIMLTVHRAETTDDHQNLTAVIESLERIQDITVIFPMHPRTKERLIKSHLYARLEQCGNISIREPMGYIEFTHAMRDAKKVMTDSGGVQKEAYIIGVPCITLRDNTEWIETVNVDWNRLTGLDSKKVEHHVRNWIPAQDRPPLFGSGHAASEILEILLSNLVKTRT